MTSATGGNGMKTKGATARRTKTRSPLERQYLEIVKVPAPNGFAHNTALLLEQPEVVVGNNFTTYSTGEIPAILAIRQ